jgi:hypothetical protein
MVFADLASKSVATVSGGLAVKSAVMVFSSLVSKLVATVSRFGPQNHRGSFLVLASKPSGLQFVDCATKPMEGGRHGTRIEI